ELDPELLEGHRTISEVGDTSISALPLHLVIGMLAFGGEVAGDADAGLLWGDGHGCTPRVRWRVGSGGGWLVVPDGRVVQRLKPGRHCPDHNPLWSRRPLSPRHHKM